jgi:hypothetical protein
MCPNIFERTTAMIFGLEECISDKTDTRFCTSHVKTYTPHHKKKSNKHEWNQ